MLRSARTLVFYPDSKSGLLAHNYLQNKRFGCSPDTVKFLNSIWDWQDTPQIAKSLNMNQLDVLQRKLDALVQAGCLIEKGSRQEREEQSHKELWQWGVPSALFHTSLNNREVVSVEESLREQALKIENNDSAPETIFEHLAKAGFPKIELPRSPLTADLQDTFDRRRTHREKGSQPVTLEELAICLHNSVGVQSIQPNEAGAPITYKPTPSGGGRAPYDAFVLAKTLDGLDEGVYAYDPNRHCLFKTGSDCPNFGQLLCDQDWPDNMDAFIVLQANFERTMWKYHDANAYRVVLIEAGHIGQNIMLAATARGLSACPSGAINLNIAVDHIYNCDPIMSPALYALGLVRPVVQ